MKREWLLWAGLAAVLSILIGYAFETATRASFGTLVEWLLPGQYWDAYSAPVWALAGFAVGGLIAALRGRR